MGSPQSAPFRNHDHGADKVAPYVADKVLNHSTGAIRGVAAVYNRHAYLDEWKAAIEALGRFVESLVRPGGVGNVIDLHARTATA